MLVSILIPCFNAQRWIAQAIESAFAQSWPEKEVIVVDDGSSDGSLEVIRSFGGRITWESGSNRGGNAARNRLLDLSRGEWLQYLDADDYLLPNKIASQLAAAREGESGVDIVYSPVIIHDIQRPGADKLIDITDCDETLTFIRWGPLNTGGLLLKRDAVSAAGGWNENQRCCQEHELFLRLKLSGCRFLLHNKAETVYRQHSSETVSRRDPLLVIRLRMGLTDRLAEHLESSGQLTTAHREALFAARMECARSAYGLDASLAAELCAKANLDGRRWVSGSPALPLSYQLAIRVAGFANAERLAAWMRQS